ncbi:hypothetical protein DL766_005036 [Monosporascus sp. MC13-8B]|uniref:Uncharacterized protein n=1 Tax=Monosporascus cannonballus TaxID=155416 RepID=A0ABY0GXA9_9PEZI|nr:hypothetical protein DL762_009187 [Monosporascus cannonballus]RYO85169.1 hypothetical protein DL763_007192 [Monosporascus cannonballus]RYP30100.1 hypothetical protein DL766_005036 [Monosporascus sp. MC13-8B]
MMGPVAVGQHSEEDGDQRVGPQVVGAAPLEEDLRLVQQHGTVPGSTKAEDRPQAPSGCLLFRSDIPTPYGVQLLACHLCDGLAVNVLPVPGLPSAIPIISC